MSLIFNIILLYVIIILVTLRGDFCISLIGELTTLDGNLVIVIFPRFILSLTFPIPFVLFFFKSFVFALNSFLKIDKAIDEKSN